MPIAMTKSPIASTGKRRATLEERDLVGADHVDDERLRQQALDEPARLKQARAVRGGRGGRDIPAAEHVEHHEVGRVVEDRRARADEHDEAGERLDVPRSWLPDLVGVDIVGRDRGLTEIVEQVVGQDLDRQHRQERDEDARAEHAEHVAEVARRTHADVLGDVREHPAAFEHALVDDEQRLLEQDHVGGLLRDVDGRVDADPDVGGMERGRVVDAVAHEADGVLARLQRLDDPLLVRRRDAREQRGDLDGIGELVVGQLVDVDAEQDGADDEADVLAHLSRDELVVSGDHLDRDAVCLQLGDGHGAGLLGRVQERDVALKDQLGFVGRAVRRRHARGGSARRGLLGGDREHPKAIGAEPLVLARQVRDVFVVHRQPRAVEVEARAPRKDRLGRALRDDPVLPLGRANHDRHDAALEVERDLVDLRDLRDPRMRVRLLVRQHRAIEDVLEAGLEVAVGVREREHGLALAQGHVAVLLEDHLVLGQRAGLVGAQHVHRAEVLDRVETLDDHLLLAHRDRALRQAHRDDHRQHLGRQAHGDGHREEERLSPVALGEAVDDEHQRHHHEHEAQQQPGEAGDVAIERGPALLLRQRRGHAAEVGLLPGRDDDGRGRAALDARAEKRERRELERGGGRTGGLGRVFLDGEALAGQRSLDHEQVLGLHDPHVARDHVARRELDDIAGDELRERSLARLAIAKRRSRGPRSSP